MEDQHLYNEEIIEDLNFDLIFNYNVSIPPCFLYKPGDILGFIDLESLLLNNFSFKNINNISNSHLFKISENELKKICDFEDDFNLKNIEKKDWGFGYAKKSNRGKGPTISVAKRVIKYYILETDYMKRKYIFEKAKFSRNINLSGVGLDFITDLVLFLKEKNIREYSEKIYKEISDKNGLDVNILIETLLKNYCKNQDLDYSRSRIRNISDHNLIAFPFLVPHELIDNFSGSFGKKFEIEVAEEFYRLILKKKLFEKEDLKYQVKKNFQEFGFNTKEKWSKFLKNAMDDKVEEMYEKIKINSFKDFSIFKNSKSWELNFLLKNENVLKNFNFKNSSYLIYSKKNDGIHYEIFKYYLRDNQIFAFSTNMKKISKMIIKFKKDFNKFYYDKNIELILIITKEKFTKVISKTEIYREIAENNIRVNFLN